MKIRKFTSLLAMMLVGAASSMAQLSWVYNGETLADGETLTVNEDILGFYAFENIGVQNEGNAPANCIIYKDNVETNGQNIDFGMCTTSCFNGDQTDPFTVNAESIFEVHIQAMGMLQNGEASVTYTVRNGFMSEATLNITFIADGDDSNNGVTIGSGSGINDIAAKECSASLQNGVLTIAGANAGQQIRVIDLTGRVAATFAVANDGTQRYDLGLGKGIYLVAIQENGRTQYVQKVIAR